ncbi:putative signal transducing protein [Parapedobacter lycopersici]|uniref:putative signal transducing protein n=1 Tax=Parapedobacter lycopersici TaxID=1864939 RepID=UPI00214DDFBC|nr:DUF2007 domain-containing protein [Parapedobacter lycopersici]
MEKDWIKLITTASPIEAEMIRQLLETNGITAVVLNKQDSSYRFGQIELYVHESVSATAGELIAGQNGLDG